MKVKKFGVSYFTYVYCVFFHGSYGGGKIHQGSNQID